MTQDATTSDDFVLDVSELDLRQLENLGDTVLARAVAKVVAMAGESTQALAGFSARVPDTTGSGTGRAARTGPRAESADRDKHR